MKGSIFFICLCFLLVKIGVPVPALATSTAITYRSVAPLPSSVATSTQKSGLELVFTEKKDDSASSVLLVGDDAEDEDANNHFDRKFKLLARTWPEFSYQSPLGCSINRSKTAPCFFGRVSYKYLLQRVIRI